MIYGSVCSGIEAASVAWHPLGWRPSFFSEIEAFPRAVLSHHFPGVPLHGDFTTIKDGDYEPIDLLVGGTPCQDFSIAGLRAGMDGDRGNLTLQFLTLARRLRPKWLVWENVPGVLSSGGGRDFGAFLGGLGELGYGWAYRTLDAQHFGVPQRRRRVFVVGYLGDWRRAAAVLFERYSLQGHSAPRRSQRERIARPIAAGSARGSGYRNDPDIADNLIAQGVALRGRDGGATAELTGSLQPALRCGAGGGDKPHVLAFGGNNTAGAIDCAAALAAHGGPHGRQDFASETFVVSSTGHGKYKGTLGTLRAEGGDCGGGSEMLVTATLRANGDAPSGFRDADGLTVCATGGVTHSLSANGFDASEDGTGRGTPLGPVALQGSLIGPTDQAGPQACGYDQSGAMFTLTKTDIHAVAFAHQASGKQTTLGYDPSSAGDPALSVGQVPAIAFDTTQITSPENRNNPRAGDPCHPLAAGAHAPAIASSAVRRLIPRECERLQGFPDDWTLVPYRGKPAADGPRYKALGNSMAVPVMAWIGQRIQMVEDIMAGRSAAE